jgi:hypothetical protein
VWSLEKVEESEVDPARVVAWADQLKDYARSIERVSRKMRGQVR